MYDLLIIGGGPAGLSAAMTARNRNLSVCVICGGAADSALHKAGHVTNYPGVPDVSGPALLETMTQQARALGADILRERALSAMPMGKTFGVSAGKEFAEGRTLLLATGIAQRGTFPGEAEFLGRGVSYCATCDGMLYRGKRAAVIGLAADAPEEADFLREIGCDMAGIGPFIPHPDTPLRDLPHGSTELTKRAVALARLLLPKANLPATTSLGVIDGKEKNDVFSCGANVIMRKVTPDAYKQKYEIYPAALGHTDIKAERAELENMIRGLGKIPQ